MTTEKKQPGQVKTVRERGMRRLTIDVTAEMHKKLKQIAVDQDTTLAIVVRNHLEKLVSGK